MGNTMILATALCVDPTPGSTVLVRSRDQRLWSAPRAIAGQGIAFARHPYAPKHLQQPLQRPSAPRPRIR